MNTKKDNTIETSIGARIQAEIRYVESSTIETIKFGKGDFFVAFSYQYKKVCLDGEKQVQEKESLEGITTKEEIQRVEKLHKENPNKILTPPRNFYKMWKKKETLNFLKKFMIAGYDDMKERLSIKNPYTYLTEKEKGNVRLEDIMVVPSSLDFLSDGLFLRNSMNGEIIPIPVMSEIPIETNENDQAGNWKDTVDKLRKIEEDGGQFFSMNDDDSDDDGHIILKKIPAIAFLDQNQVKFDQKMHFFLEDESPLHYFAFLPSLHQLKNMMKDMAESSSEGKNLEELLIHGEPFTEKQWRLLVEGPFDCEHGEFSNILKLADIKN